MLVVGSREFSELERVREFVRALPAGTTVISGGARGVDKTAIEEALSLGLGAEEHLAEWDKYGKRAGYLRNEQMVLSKPDFCVAFWDGKSCRTMHTINLCREHGIPVEVIHDEVQDPVYR